METLEKKERVLIEFQEGAFNQVRNRIIKLIIPLKRVGQALIDCGINPAHLNLESLFKHPRTALLPYLPKELKNLADMIDPEMLKLPDAFNTLIKLVTDVKASTDIKYFSLTKDGGVAQVDKEWILLKEMYTQYAEGEQEIQRMELALKFRDLLLEYRGLAYDLNLNSFSYPVDLQSLFNKMLRQHNENGSAAFTPRVDFIKRGEKSSFS